MQNFCGIIAPSLLRTGGHSCHARRAEGRSSVMDEEEDEKDEEDEGGGRFNEFSLCSPHL